MDSKSIGLCPQGFESPRCRFLLGVGNASLPIVTSRAQAPLGTRGLMRCVHTRTLQMWSRGLMREGEHARPASKRTGLAHEHVRAKGQAEVII
jgi:hypothetical protein